MMEHDGTGVQWEAKPTTVQTLKRGFARANCDPTSQGIEGTSSIRFPDSQVQRSFAKMVGMRHLCAGHLSSGQNHLCIAKYHLAWLSLLSVAHLSSVVLCPSTKRLKWVSPSKGTKSHPPLNWPRCSRHVCALRGISVGQFPLDAGYNYS